MPPATGPVDSTTVAGLGETGAKSPATTVRFCCNPIIGTVQLTNWPESIHVSVEMTVATTFAYCPADRSMFP